MEPAEQIAQLQSEVERLKADLTATEQATEAEVKKLQAKVAYVLGLARGLLAVVYQVNEWAEYVFWQPASAEILGRLKEAAQSTDQALKNLT